MVLAELVVPVPTWEPGFIAPIQVMEKTLEPNVQEAGTPSGIVTAKRGNTVV